MEKRKGAAKTKSIKATAPENMIRSASPKSARMILELGVFLDEALLKLFMQVLQRLEFMHDVGYLHRDLKPENIMIGNGKKANMVFLIDFGLAKRYICPSSG